MDFKEKMQAYKIAAEEVKRMADDLKMTLLKEIEKAKLDGVEEVSDAPNTFVIKLSTIMSTPGHILSPEYYSQKSQYEAVRKALYRVYDPANLGKTVQRMIEEKRVRTDENNYVYLNGNTLKVLKDSELGQFALME